MKRFLRLVSLTLLIMSTSGNTFAEEKVNVARQGTIRGRIVDTSKQILPGASIYIEKLHTGVTSDVNGYYTFANLTPGTYTVKVSYVGYSPVEMKITIPAGKTLEKDVVLNEGLELQEVVVGGAFQGQRRAINSQKNNLGITNVVSADQVGKFPDSNIGDALKRINGINVQYDQGEARFGQVRGTSADLSSVTINGNRLPSAEGDTRNVQLYTGMTHGEIQLDFVYACSKISGMNLLDFFTKWGFLTPVDKELDDYGKKQLTVTQDMIDALKQKVNALGGTRPDVALEYISDNTYELYKTKPAIIKGENATHAPKTFTVGSGDNAVTYNGETITIKNWTNVVTYEVKDETGKFILICSGENAPSSVDTFTIPVRWKDGFRLSAVSVTGERIDIPMN